MSKNKMMKIKTNTFTVPVPKPRNPLFAAASHRKAGVHPNTHKNDISKGHFKSNMKKGNYE